MGSEDRDSSQDKTGMVENIGKEADYIAVST